MNNSVLWSQFHTMWGFAKDGLAYRKEDWNELQRLIEELERPSDTQRFLVPDRPTALLVIAAMLVVDEKRWFRMVPMQDEFEITVSKEALPLIVRQLIATAYGVNPPTW